MHEIEAFVRQAVSVRSLCSKAAARRLLKFAYAAAGDRRLVAHAIIWRVLGRKVRARNALAKAAAQSAYAYSYWLRFVEPRTLAPSSSSIRRSVGQRIKVVIAQDPGTDPALIMRSAKSVRTALLVDADVVTLGAQPHADANTLVNLLRRIEPVERPAGDSDPVVPYVLLLNAGDCVHVDFASAIGAALADGLNAPIVYWDEDRTSWQDRRADPWFKPDWDPLHFRSQDYVTGACMIRIDALLGGLAASAASHGGSPRSATNGEMLPTDMPAVVFHISHVLTHRHDGTTQSAMSAMQARLLQTLLTGGGSADVNEVGDYGRVSPQSSPSSSVTVIVPTRDQLSLLAACISGVRRARYHGTVDICIVDNGSTDASTIAYLEEQKRLGATVLDCGGPFNFARLNNIAVEQAQGQFVCFMNNDVEPCDDDWLSHLMRYAARPESGAVGAKLLYPDGSIQHAGVTIGTGGAAGHMHRFVRNEDRGYFNHPHIARYCSAVTAACMIVERKKFLEVGGFDAENFAVAFNDVDLCLRLTQAGWKNIYVPDAQLIHHESKSRGSDMAPANRERYFRELGNLQRIWDTENYIDPYLNRNLTRAVEQMIVDLK